MTCLLQAVENAHSSVSVNDVLAVLGVNDVLAVINYGISLAALNEREAAQRVIERLTQVEGQKYLKGEHTYSQACILAHLGELDEAMQLLEQAYREGNSFGWYLIYDIEMAPFQDYPPFQEWLKTPRG